MLEEHKHCAKAVVAAYREERRSISTARKR